MARKINYGKILAVLFLTILIWVWADLAKTDVFKVEGTTVNIATPSDPTLWVSFPEGPSVVIDEIVVKGATSKIDRLQRSIRAGERLRFDLDTAEERMVEKGDHTLHFLPFLNKWIQEKYGLKVESCSPEKIAVHVRTLVHKSLEVTCLDESGNVVKASVDPGYVDMFIPGDVAPVATVILTSEEIEQARTTPISRKPFFEFGPGQRKLAGTVVKIATPLLGLLPETIDTPRLGYTLSGNLQGKYEVVIDEASLVNAREPIRIKATTAAKLAYESMLYQVILEIKKDDEKALDGLTRALKYNFPDQYLRSNQIDLNQDPVEVRFKLIKLPTPPPTPIPES
jgi:hypothetical protein